MSHRYFLLSARGLLSVSVSLLTYPTVSAHCHGTSHSFTGGQRRSLPTATTTRSLPDRHHSVHHTYKNPPTTASSITATTHQQPPKMTAPTPRLAAALPLILALLAAVAPGPAAARTDYEGCVSTALPATTVWYVPGTGELCEPVDCGGGRAPPKTVPGCPAYKGTETVTPKFWEGYAGGGAQATPTAVPGAGGGAGKGGDGDGDGEDSEDDGEGEDGGSGVGVGVGVTGAVKGTVTVTLGGGTAAASRTASKTKDVQETGAAGAGDDTDDEDDDSKTPGSTASATGGGRRPVATLTQVMTAVETVDGVVRPVPTGAGDGQGAPAQTVSLAAAVPTAVVGKAVFGVVAAGVAAAGFVLA